jgi:putative ABC transport system permease protein
MAAMGLYGVMHYVAAQRTHEIGIRLALGAHSADVLRLIIIQGMRLTLIGLAAGLLASFALSRVMAQLLFSVSATDPLNFRRRGTRAHGRSVSGLLFTSSQCGEG